MKQYVKKALVAGIMVIMFNLMPDISYAQIDPGQDPDAPIDGGVTLLVAAGVGYGVKKIRDSRNKNCKQ